MTMSYGARTGTPVVLPIVEAMKAGGLFNLKTSTGNQIFATFTRTLYEWRQDGDCVDINVKATLTSAWTGSGTHLELEIPTTDFTFAAGLDTIEGTIRAYDGSTYTTLGFVALTVAGNRIRFLPMQQTDAAQAGTVRNQNDYATTSPFTWASGCVIFISIRGLKCSGFAGMSTQAYNAGLNPLGPSLVQKRINSTKVSALQGATTAPNITIKQVRVDDIVTISFTVSGLVTKNATPGALQFQLDPEFIPANAVYVLSYGIVNNVGGPYMWYITTGGVVGMLGTATGSNIAANTANCGWDIRLTLTYNLG